MPQNSPKAKSPEKHARSKSRNATRRAFEESTGMKWIRRGSWADQSSLNAARRAA